MKTAVIPVAAVTVLVAACGGGGGSSASSTTPTVNQSVAGIWEGSNVENGVTVQTVARSDPAGLFYAASLNTSNNCADVTTGTVTVSGNTYSGSIVAAIVDYSTGSSIQTDCEFTDGSTWAHGTISGTVTAGTTLTETSAMTTGNGMVLPSDTGTLSFNNLYNQSSSLADIAGNWTGPTGVVTTINSDGTFYAQDPSTDCVVNGQYSIINASYNLYAGSATYSNCAGNAAVLNGKTASGLFTLNNQVSPNEIEGGASVTL